jgi:hypothetical protein
MQMQPARRACICACKCNQLAAPVSAHANATSPPRPLARRTAHTSHLQLCTRFAVLCAGFVWFVVLSFPKFNLYTLVIAKVSCVRSSVGTELRNLAHGPGFDSGRKFSVSSFIGKKKLKILIFAGKKILKDTLIYIY